MPHYETVIVLRQDLSTTQAEAIVNDTKNALQKADAVVSREETWGVKTLSYPIKKNKKGHYFLINHSNSTQTTQEMERVLRLNADLLRLMTIRTENPEKEPSPMIARAQSEQNLADNDENQKQQRKTFRKKNDEQNPVTENTIEKETIEQNPIEQKTEEAEQKTEEAEQETEEAEQETEEAEQETEEAEQETEEAEQETEEAEQKTEEAEQEKT